MLLSNGLDVKPVLRSFGSACRYMLQHTPDNTRSPNCNRLRAVKLR